MTETADPKAPPGALSVALRLGGGFLLAVFGAGIVTGLISAWREHGEFRTGVIVGLALAALLLASGCWLMLSVRRSLAIPRSPRVRRSRIALYLSFGLSFVIGTAVGMAGFFSSADHDDVAGGLLRIFGGTPIARPFALAAIAAWIVVMAASLYWHRTLDEIERAEYEFGGTAAMYVYLLGAPCWWLGWRGGLVPRPDEFVIFMAVCTVWCIGWGWRRWR